MVESIERMPAGETSDLDRMLVVVRFPVCGVGAIPGGWIPKKSLSQAVMLMIGIGLFLSDRTGLLYRSAVYVFVYVHGFHGVGIFIFDLFICVYGFGVLALLL